MMHPKISELPTANRCLWPCSDTWLRAPAV